MTLLMLLEMIASAFGDRVGIGTSARGLTYQDLYDRAGAGAEVLRRHGAQHLAYIGSSDEAFPVALFASAWAGVPFIPLNYRLGEEQLRSLLASHADVLVVADGDVWCDPAKALAHVHEFGWAIPHALIHRLAELSTEMVMAGADWHAFIGA